MQLVIGGSYQGKTRYIEENFPEYRIYDEKNFRELCRGENRQEDVVWNHLHLCVKELLEIMTPEEIGGLVEKVVKAHPDMVLVSDEIGSGIVPMERAERQYREVTGRLLCNVAKNAEKVVRVTCGIPMRIK